jgi:hypothetical protein
MTMMKPTAAAIVLLALAIPLAAQEAPRPDYSKDNLLRLFAGEERPEPPPRFEFHPGWIDFRLFGQRFRFSPLLGALPGSELGTTKQWPDPFALTGAEIAQTPETFVRRREVNAELRRLERRIRRTSKVKVDAQ